MNIAEIKDQQAKNAARKPHIDRIKQIEGISDRVERLQAIRKYWLSLNRENHFQDRGTIQVAFDKSQVHRDKHGANKTGSMRHALTMPGGLVETIMAFERFRHDNIFKPAGRDTDTRNRASKDLKKAFPMYVAAGRTKA